MESVRPANRIGSDGFPLRETVSEYIQILTLRAIELRDEVGLALPEGMDPEMRIRIYGGGTLIFDEYGRLKYQIAKHLAKDDGDRARQSERLAYLFENGRLEQPRDATGRLAALHMARAGVEGALR